jgi:minor extracellular serine protease Vpr
MQYIVPFLIHFTPGAISVNQQNQELVFEINHPDKWSFAKISVINSKDGSTHTTTTTPNKKATMKIYENSEYWIDAKIQVNGNTSNAFNTIEISSLSENQKRMDIVKIPEKQIGIITVILVGIIIFGIMKRKQSIVKF